MCVFFSWSKFFRINCFEWIFATGAFEDEDIIHVENSVDPIRDMEIITGELRQKDIQTIEKCLHGVSVAKRNQDKDLNARCLMEEKFLEHLRAGKDIRNGEWNSKEVSFRFFIYYCFVCLFVLVFLNK